MYTCAWSVRAGRLWETHAPAAALAFWEESRRQRVAVEDGGSRLTVCS